MEPYNPRIHNPRKYPGVYARQLHQRNQQRQMLQHSLPSLYMEDKLNHIINLANELKRDLKSKRSYGKGKKRSKRSYGKGKKRSKRRSYGRRRSRR